MKPNYTIVPKSEVRNFFEITVYQVFRNGKLVTTFGDRQTAQEFIDGRIK